MKIDDNFLLEQIKEFYLKNGKTPTKNDVVNSKNTYARHFGSWNNAVKLAGVPLNRKEKSPRITIECENCGKLTKNPRFCSKNCSASKLNKEHKIGHGHSNRIKKKIKYCNICNTEIINGRKIKCDKCYMDSMLSNQTLGQLRNRLLKKNNTHRASLYALVREHARKLYKREIKIGCEICGYSKHAEACHLIAINTYSDDTTVGEINKRENIKILCRNCHWELDHGLL